MSQACGPPQGHGCVLPTCLSWQAELTVFRTMVPFLCVLWLLKWMLLFAVFGSLRLNLRRV
jgi:hypothetical protein